MPYIAHGQYACKELEKKLIKYYGRIARRERIKAMFKKVLKFFSLKKATKGNGNNKNNI